MSELCLLLFVFCLPRSAPEEVVELGGLCSDDLEMGVVLLLWECAEVRVWANTPTTRPLAGLREARVTAVFGLESIVWALLIGWCCRWTLVTSVSPCWLTAMLMVCWEGRTQMLLAIDVCTEELSCDIRGAPAD